MGTAGSLALLPRDPGDSPDSHECRPPDEGTISSTFLISIRHTGRRRRCASATIISNALCCPSRPTSTVSTRLKRSRTHSFFVNAGSTSLSLNVLSPYRRMQRTDMTESSRKLSTSGMRPWHFRYGILDGHRNGSMISSVANGSIARYSNERHREILAMIPARGARKGVPRKNIASMRGKPLIALDHRGSAEIKVRRPACPVRRRTKRSFRTASGLGCDVAFRQTRKPGAG